MSSMRNLNAKERKITTKAKAKYIYTQTKIHPS